MTTRTGRYLSGWEVSDNFTSREQAADTLYLPLQSSISSEFEAGINTSPVESTNRITR